MQCSSCGLAIAEGARFCQRCGAAQAAGPCHSCGRMSAPGSRFCGNCGSPLAAPTPGATPAEPPPGHASPQTSTASETPPGQSTRPTPGHAPGAGVCPKCGSVLPPNAAYCFACGRLLDGTAASGGLAAGPVAGDAATAAIRAGFWIRFAAFLIDACVLGLVEFLLILLHPGVGLEVYSNSESLLQRTDTWIDWAAALMGVGYFTAGVAVWSTTIGKRLLGLSVQRPDGARVGWGRALARYWAVALLVWFGFLLVALRPDKRALHDLLCDTVVVRRPPPPL